jgi:hypothetical protein
MGKPAKQDVEESQPIIEFLAMKKSQTKSEMKWYSGESDHFFILSGSFF